MEVVYGPETRAEWIARQRAARLELREQLWREAARDPHWLNRANRHLERALEENATRYGLHPYAVSSTPVPEPLQAAQDENLGVYHHAAEEVPAEALEPRQASGPGGVAI